MEKYKNEPGVCPKCGSHDLEYDVINVECEAAYYPYTCNDCGQEGEEWYSMEFTGHNIITKSGEVIEL